MRNLVQSRMRLLPILLLAATAFGAEPVITLDYIGGYSPKRLSKEPYLQIFADGTIRARNPFRKEKTSIDKMSKDAVKQLVKELSPKIEAPKKWPGKLPPIVDAATTVIRVGKKEAKQYALGYAAKDFLSLRIQLSAGLGGLTIALGFVADAIV